MWILAYKVIWKKVILYIIYAKNGQEWHHIYSYIAAKRQLANSATSKIKYLN